MDPKVSAALEMTPDAGMRLNGKSIAFSDLSLAEASAKNDRTALEGFDWFAKRGHIVCDDVTYAALERLMEALSGWDGSGCLEVRAS